ncbi:receptor-interacting serine/threonine-protein kinase 1-like [Glandiceps talaboti]
MSHPPTLQKLPSQFFITHSSKIADDELLGAGHFGQVYKAQHSDWGIVAVKHLFSSAKLSGKEKTDLESEADKMSKVRCPYAVILFGVILEPANYSLVVEYMKFKSLKDFQDDYVNPWPMKIQMIYHAILGMNFLHTTAKIVHRDVKIDNIMVGEGFIAKIGDFGLAMWKKYTRKYSKKTTPGSSGRGSGTISHISPECLDNINTKVSYTCDVYSFGITLWEIVTGEEPYSEAYNSVQILSCIVNGQRPDESEIPEQCPEFLKKMMKDCWHGDATKRPSFGELKEVIEKELKTKYECEMSSAIIDLQEQIRQKSNPLTLTSDMNPVQQPSEDTDVADITERIGRTSLQPSPPQPVVGDVRAQEVVTDAGPKSLPPSSSIHDSSKSCHEPYQETATTPGPYQIDAAGSGDGAAPGGHSQATQGASAAPGIQPTTIHTTGIKHGSTNITISGNPSGIQIGNQNYMVVQGAARTPAGKKPTTSRQKIKVSTSTTPVKLDDLDDISKHIGSDFRTLGRRLGFSNGELDGFHHDYSKLTEMNYQMLYSWVQSNGKKATRGKLAEVLCKIKLYDIAAMIPYN